MGLFSGAVKAVFADKIKESDNKDRKARETAEFHKDMRRRSNGGDRMDPGLADQLNIIAKNNNSEGGFW